MKIKSSVREATGLHMKCIVKRVVQNPHNICELKKIIPKPLILCNTFPKAPTCNKFLGSRVIFLSGLMLTCQKKCKISIKTINVR